MDPVLLSRLQFALTVGFHFLFPPTTLALTLFILIFETRHVRHGREVDRQISSFLVRILGLVFVLGTATGVVMEFAFGNNWAQYSRLVGDIFGPPLAAEAILAFFLESVFLGLLVFGRARLSRRAYLVSAWMVAVGAHLSGLWIIAANSWMQTPAGFRLVGDRAVLTDFVAATFNHSTLIRTLHTILASWITGALLIVAIAAWYRRKGRHAEHARALLGSALAVLLLASLVQLGTGHVHSVQVAKTQPAKMAAFEALWQTRPGAPLTLFAIPRPDRERNSFYVGLPRALSLLVFGDANATVTGLDRIAPPDRPPLLLTFFSYRLMVLLGCLFVVLAGASLTWGLWRKVPFPPCWLRLLTLAAPLGYVACEAGWVAAEVGRQPWAVYGILRTRDAISRTVPAWQVLASLIAFTLLYALLLWVFLRILLRIVRQGPEAPERAGY